MGSGSKSTPKFGDATQQFRDAGIPGGVLLPIAPVDARISGVGDFKEDVLGKSPGRFHKRNGTWSGLYIKDRNHLREGLTAEHRKAFADWPTPNVGIIGRYAPAIDSDAESEDARRLVERALDTAFGNAAIAERKRGNVSRRLYAFLNVDPHNPDSRVRSRSLTYKLGADGPTDKPHKIDIIGYGRQFLIAGRHQSGDDYRWAKGWGLCDLVKAGTIEKIDNSDMDRFLAAFEAELAADGGAVLNSSGGHAPGEEKDWSEYDPIFPINKIFDGLDRIPNNAENFETRDEFVSMLASIRAALGNEAEAERSEIEAWACADPDWCPPEYFDKAWDSLDRGVRVDRHSLDRRFRQAGVFASAQHEFAEASDDGLDVPAQDRAKRKEARNDTLDVVASRYIFGRVNTDTDDNVLRMRSSMDASVEFSGVNWWKFQTDDTDVSLVKELHESFAVGEAGFWDFIRAMRKYESRPVKKGELENPRLFYTGKTRNPNYPRGAIVVEHNVDGSEVQELNLRFQSPVIKFAETPPKDEKQAREDVARILDFIDRVFHDPKLAAYELDTLAFMVQTGRRPGHMLLLVGESGVGKSTYIQMLISMFDGVGKDMGSQIDGTKIANEAARRFALAKVEGCRIISIKELPEGSTASNMAAVTASIKQIVDPGTDGDYIEIERKRKDTVSVRNFARVVSTSNYANALQIEKHDRRIFYVLCGITLDTKPGPNWYSDLNDVTGSPKRLAAFWRYLQARDVSHYDPAAAPPVSKEKAEAQLAGLPAWDRHYEAAMATLRAGKRSLFDLGELGELMTAMADNEHANTDGQTDDRRAYDFGKAAGAAASSLKRLERYSVKLLRPKVNGERLPPVYGLRTARPLLDKLAGADRDDILEALDRDRETCTLPRAHPLSDKFDGPLKPANRSR